MRRYDDPVEVRRGAVDDTVLGAEAPVQFLWRGRLWKVRAVLARWVETGAWWQSGRAQAVIGTGDDGGDGAATDTLARPADLLGEREVWRVEAGRGGLGTAGDTGVFELSLDWSDGRWLLVGCED